MIRLRLSKKMLRTIVWCVSALVLVAGLYGVGTWVTPRDSTGRPMVWVPSLRAAEQYRSQAHEWVGDMEDIDRRLTAILSDETGTEATELYTQGREMQAIGEKATALAQQIKTTQVPVSLVGLRERAQTAANTYLEAALATARWLNAPSETGHRVAVDTLRAARNARVTLEESQWMRTDHQ